MGRKVTLSDPSPEGIVAELLLLLEEVSSDGLITEDEAKRLHEWLTLNRDAGILAFDFLRTTLDHVLADGKITDPERKAIHKAVERVLPPELRLGARTSREARELVERARVEEERASKRQAKEEGRRARMDERLRSRPVYTLNCLVAGVSFEDRAAVIEEKLAPNDSLRLVRELNNPHDSNAGIEAVAVQVGQKQRLARYARGVSAAQKGTAVVVADVAWNPDRLAASVL